MANNYKLIFVASDSADVAKKIEASMLKLPATANGPIVLATQVVVREVKPADGTAPFTKHICQVLATPSGIAHAATLADFSGSEYIYLDAPDNAFKTSVVLTDNAGTHLTFPVETAKVEEPGKDTGATNNAAPKGK